MNAKSKVFYLLGLMMQNSSLSLFNIANDALPLYSRHIENLVSNNLIIVFIHNL